MKKQITEQEVLDLAKEMYGIAPGIIKETAKRSAAVAYMYTWGSALMESGTFSPVELNAIELRVSALNHCESCIKGHSYLLKKEGIPDDFIRAIMAGTETTDHRINILLQATEYIFYAGGDIYPDHVLHFLQENITENELTEIIGLISLKTIANYLNNYLASVNLIK